MAKDKRLSNDAIIESQLKTVATELKDGVFIFTGKLTISQFAHKINKPSNEIVGFFFKKGLPYNINHVLDEEQIAELCLLYEFDFHKEDEITAQNFMERVEINEQQTDLQSRPPIITIMGHVDHGKTTLIDQIRHSAITKSEAGGITQHTGAYQVEVDGHKITFLDTPGHEAFTAMRARGASLTDIVVLVVAADDGVKPQTKEAIVHAQAAGVPIIVFVNKMDLHGADPEKIMTALSKLNVMSEKWGGDVQFITGSALNNEGIDKLFSAINIQAEMLQLRANPNRQPMGVVVESRIDKGKGTVATLIVQNGTLRARDFIVAGAHYGKIRTMLDSWEKPIDKALPGTPVRITGLNYTPSAGDKFFGFIDEKFAKKLATEKQQLDKTQALRDRSVFSVKDGIKVYNIIIKADVDGTTEAVKYALSKIANDEAQVNVINASVGMVTKSDLILAEASHATIFAFNIRPAVAIKKMALENGVTIKSYTVIYEMIAEVEAILKGMLAPKFEEKVLGQAIIQKIIFYSKVGNIAGCVVDRGEMRSDAKIRLIRDGRVIHEGILDSLQQGKNAIKKVKTGQEFGCHIKNYNDIKINDVIEPYVMEQVAT